MSDPRFRPCEMTVPFDRRNFEKLDAIAWVGGTTDAEVSRIDAACLQHALSLKIPRAEQSIRINPNVIKVSVIGAVLIAAGLVLFTPDGKSPEVLPIVGLIAAAQLSIAGGVAYWG